MGYPDVELHELEREKAESAPNRRSANDDEILAERIIGDELPIVAIEGEGFIGPFERANRKRQKGIGGFKQYLLPFTIYTKRRGAVEIRADQKFYFDEIEGHVWLEEARIDTDGRITVRLGETGAAFPSRSWTFRTEDLARYLEAGELKAMDEVNDEAEQLLEDLRAEREEADD